MKKNKRPQKKLSATGCNPKIPAMTKKAQKRHGKHLRPGNSFAEKFITKNGLN